MKPFTDEQLWLHRASEPRGLADIAMTEADRGQPTAPDLLRQASQGHSAAVDRVPAAADFPPCVQAAASERFSFPSASQGNMAAVGPGSMAATSHRIAGWFGEVVKATDAPKRR